MSPALPHQLVALVRLDDTTQHRVICVPADDLLVVERSDEDTLGDSTAPRPWSSQGGMGPKSTAPAHTSAATLRTAATALDGFRTLIAWCEAHQVADPVALNPGDEVSPHEIQLHVEDFGRLTSRPGIRVHERPSDRYVHRLAEIDGVQVRTVLDCLSLHPQTPDQEQK